MMETRSTWIEMHPADCVIVRCRPGITQTVADARENMDVSVALCGGKRLRPVLVNITQTAPLSSEVRHYFVAAMPDAFTAVALVVEDTPLGHMMGTVFFQMIDKVYRQDDRGEDRVRVFTDEESAIKWLTSERR